jgi:hypothetical protein
MKADDASACRELERENVRWKRGLGELGHAVNRKRVQRLRREEGLRVPARRRKRQRLGESSAPPAGARGARDARRARI